jgi:hypothetical protein
MKLNRFVSGSHIIAEGFSQTYKQWYQIGPPCPPTAGPIDWHMYSCEMIIPYDINKIRLILNGGLSQKDPQAASDDCEYFRFFHCYCSYCFI